MNKNSERAIFLRYLRQQRYKADLFLTVLSIVMVALLTICVVWANDDIYAEKAALERSIVEMARNMSASRETPNIGELELRATDDIAVITYRGKHYVVDDKDQASAVRSYIHEMENSFIFRNVKGYLSKEDICKVCIMAIAFVVVLTLNASSCARRINLDEFYGKAPQ